MSPRFYTPAAALLSVALVAIAWWPFHLDPPVRKSNGATLEVVAGETELRTGSEGLVCDRRPGWLDDAIRWGELRIKLRAATAEPAQVGPARILSIGQDIYQQNLMIGQEGGDLVVRVRRAEADSAGIPELRVPGLMGSPLSFELEVQVLTDRIALWVDGALVAEERTQDPMAEWDSSFELTLANEATGDRPWLGTISDLEIVTRGLPTTTLSSRELRRPAHYWLMRDYMRHSERCWWMPWGNSWDLLLNIIGFMPLGWLVARSARSRAILVGAMVALLLSATIEAGQVFLAARVPSLLDLAANGLGGGLGAALALRLFGRHKA